MSKKRKWVVIVLAVLVLIWTAVVFAQSAKSGEESTNDTNKVIELIENIADIIGVDADVSTKLLRKGAHFGEYALLGALAASAALIARKRIFCIGSFLYAVAVASCDEFVVQRMTEGRGPQFTDVLIDSGGAMFGILLIIAIYCFFETIQHRKSTGKHEKKC